MIIINIFYYSDLMNTLSNLPRIISTKNNERLLLIGQHEQAVAMETDRQHELANGYREQCQSLLKHQEAEFLKVFLYTKLYTYTLFDIYIYIYIYIYI